MHPSSVTFVPGIVPIVEGPAQSVWRRIGWSVVVALTAGVGVLSLSAFVPDGSIVRGDGLAYFMYAKSIVLDGDTDVTPEFGDVERFFGGSEAVTSSILTFSHRSPQTGKIVLAWPIGAGIVMAPFYAAGYLAEVAVATAQDRAPNPYGLLPQYFYGLGSVLFGVLAFWTATACCERVASPRSARLASLSVLLAGPAVFYIFFAATMAHAPSLGLVGVLTWLWLRCWQGRTQGLFWLGLLVGTLIAIRYQNVIFGIMVLALVARDTWQHGLKTGARESAVVAAGVLVPVALQAWHYIAMNGLSLGYGGDEYMVLNHAAVGIGTPRVTQLLLSCDKGAFYWAPVLAIGFAGLVYAAWQQGWARVTLAVFVADVLLLSLIRNNGDSLDMRSSFGMRYLIECSIGFAMGFAMLADKARSVVAWRSWIALGIVLTAWNLLLVLAYVLTIPREGCVTYPEMATGMAQAVGRVIAIAGFR